MLALNGVVVAAHCTFAYLLGYLHLHFWIRFIGGHSKMLSWLSLPKSSMAWN
jgi:hypothetical protein